MGGQTWSGGRRTGQTEPLGLQTGHPRRHIERAEEIGSSTHLDEEKSSLKKILRSAVLVAGIATSITMGMTSANAAGAGVFTGTAKINSFGTGASSGTADLCVHGYVLGQPVVGACVEGVTGRVGNVKATFDVFEASATCPLTGQASGSFSGAVNGTFNWTRVGATAVISITGGNLAGGSGTAAFKVTEPAGLPCGGPVVATVVGAIVDPS